MKSLILIAIAVMTFTLASSMSFAAEPEAVQIFDADGRLTQTALDLTAKQRNEYVDKVFVDEGGKRSRDVINAEFIVNSTIDIAVENSEKDLDNKDFANVHRAVYISEKQIEEFGLDGMNLNKDWMALLHSRDGDAYFMEGLPLKSIISYRLSNQYKESAYAHFRLGLSTYLKDGFNKKKTSKDDKYLAEHYFKVAVMMDPAFKNEVKTAKKMLKEKKKI